MYNELMQGMIFTTTLSRLRLERGASVRTGIVMCAIAISISTQFVLAQHTDDSSQNLDVAEECSTIVPQSSVAQLGAVVDCGDRQVIDVLWVYTPAALNDIGTEEWIELFCELSIEDANEAFSNSDLPFAVRMVGLMPTMYDEGGDHLTLIQGQSDGVMDEIHEARDLLAADLVVLITVDGYCGIAYIAPTNEAYGFQKISSGCLVATSAFRHELGHNLGSKHWSTDQGGFFPYSAGHVLAFEGGETFGTAMGGNQLPHYSNPRVEYEGVQTGVVIGEENAADNWYAFMQTAPMVASFRCSDDCNGNGIADVDEIDSGLAEDCDKNGVPDECQIDLNNNGVVDSCDTHPVQVRVPEDVFSLQLAISMAEAGVHEILVSPGVWDGPIDTLGKAITIRSSDGPESTIISGNGIGHAITIHSGESSDTIIDGFTVLDGTANEGGGLLIDNASPEIRNCVFKQNNADYAGGAVRVTNGFPLFNQCVFESNTASWGGAVSSFSGGPQFMSCEFLNNESRDDGRGGAVSAWTSDARFVECEFSNNTAASNSEALFIVDGGGAYAPYIEGTLFCNNSPSDINEAQWSDGGGNLFQELCPCLADITGDGIINFFDVSAFLQAFNGKDLVADFTGDGVFNFFDISAFLLEFTAGCS